MNNVIDEVLAGEPRYTIKDNGGTTLYDNVQIDLKTQVTTAGTPLNKALFDSIQADLNTRLLISDKATQSEAHQGTNDTKYMTPKKVMNKLQNLALPSSETAQGLYTLIDFTGINFDTRTYIVTISGNIDASGNGYKIIINGSGISYFSSNTSGSTSVGTTLELTQNSIRGKQGFEFRIDINSKSFSGVYIDSTGLHTLLGAFSSITNFQIRLYQGSTYTATIQSNC